MALDSKNNIKSVFIVPADLATVPTPVVGTKVTPGSLGTGKVVVTNVANQVLDTIDPDFNVTNFDTIKIVKDRGADLPLQQVRLSLKDIVAFSGECGEKSTEQVSFVGSNGTTGSINVISSNFYIIKLEHVPNAFLYGKRPANYKYGTFQSTASSTEEDIAFGLTKSLVQNFKVNRTIDWRVKSETVSDAAVVAPVVYNLSLTKYSKTAVADAAGAAVGDIIRVADVGTNVSVQSPVYKVVAVDITGLVLTLNYAYQGETGTTALADIENITGAVNPKYGVKITGIKQKYDVNRWRQYDKVRFNTLLENFGATGVTTTAAFDGLGVYEQAANDEYISWGDEGQVFVDQVPPLFREQDASKSIEQSTRGAYDVAVLGWVNKLPSLIGAGENKGTAILYMEDVCIVGNQAEALILALNTWLTGKLNPVVFGCCEEIVT